MISADKIDILPSTKEDLRLYALLSFLEPDPSDAFNTHNGNMAFILGVTLDNRFFTAPKSELRLRLRTSEGMSADNMLSSQARRQDAFNKIGEECQAFEFLFDDPGIKEFLLPLSPGVLVERGFLVPHHIINRQPQPSLVIKGRLEQYLRQFALLGKILGFIREDGTDEPVGLFNLSVNIMDDRDGKRIHIRRGIILSPKYRGMGIAVALNKLTDDSLNLLATETHCPVILESEIKKSNERSLINARKHYGAAVREDDTFYYFIKEYPC